MELEFWVDYGGGVVRVGKGNIVGEVVVTELQDTDSPYHVHAVSLSTQSEETGRWRLFKGAGKKTFP